MGADGHHLLGSDGERGQAALLMLGLLTALLGGILVLFGFGQALGARGHAQRAADLAAVSAGQVMRRNYPRLFEPAVLRRGVPNPRRLSHAAYPALARAAALRGARRNGVSASRVEVRFRHGFAPTGLTVSLREQTTVRLSAEREEAVEVGARATAEIAPEAGAAMPAEASGGGYSGPARVQAGQADAFIVFRVVKPHVASSPRSPRRKARLATGEPRARLLPSSRSSTSDGRSWCSCETSAGASASPVFRTSWPLPRLLGPGGLDLEQLQDPVLGRGEAVEDDAIGGVGQA
jgi:Putative Flp pilus-assembly TadE/G-like